MEQKIFVVEGRQFRTESDYARARRDKEIIDKLRQEIDPADRESLERLLRELRGGRYKFMTLLGQDFRDEVEELLKKAAARDVGQKTDKKKARTAGCGTEESRGRSGGTVREGRP